MDRYGLEPGQAAEEDFEVEVRGLSKSFSDRHGNRVKVLHELSLRVRSGDFWVILGPSGCGKTTLLRCLAGLEGFDDGQVRVGQHTTMAGERPPRRRQVGMVFQNYALWPHMSVASNVGYPLRNVPRSARLSRKMIRSEVEKVLGAVMLQGLGNRMIGELSGGQQQRVALARALVAGKGTVLFDEPLSSVDAKVRAQLRAEIRTIQRRLGFTAIYVTHDQEEAFELADVIAVMKSGRIEQMASGPEVYQSPASEYVADFVGRASMLRGRLVARDGDSVVVQTDIGNVRGHARSPVTPGARVVVITRPHAWRMAAPQGLTAGANQWQGRVAHATYLGEASEYDVEIGAASVTVRVPVGFGGMTPVAGELVGLEISESDCLVLPDAEYDKAADSNE